MRIEVRSVNGDGPTCGCGSRSALHLVTHALDVFLCRDCTVEAVVGRLTATGQVEQGPPLDMDSVARHHAWGHHDSASDRWCPQCEMVAVGAPLVAQVEGRMDGKFSPADRRAVAEVIGDIVTEHGREGHPVSP